MNPAENTKAATSIFPISVTVDTLGVVVDCTGFGEGFLIASMGAAAAGGGGEFELHNAVTSGGSYAIVTGQETATFADTDDGSIKMGRFRPDPARPFYKVNFDITGAFATVICASIILSETPQKRPINTLDFSA